jgi:hypothetical protein
LRRLYLDGNKLAALHPKMFSQLDGLFILDLEGNACIDQNFMNITGHFARARIEEELAGCGANYALQVQENYQEL